MVVKRLMVPVLVALHAEDCVEVNLFAAVLAAHHLA
jgi:hypothetical protein